MHDTSLLLFIMSIACGVGSRVLAIRIPNESLSDLVFGLLNIGMVVFLIWAALSFMGGH